MATPQQQKRREEKLGWGEGKQTRTNREEHFGATQYTAHMNANG
jgi:hypothetical protein